MSGSVWHGPFIGFLQNTVISTHNMNSTSTAYCTRSKNPSANGKPLPALALHSFLSLALLVIHLYRGRQVPKPPHPLTESSPSEPNEHVEIQWILICHFIRTRDESGGIYWYGNWKEKGPHFFISCTFYIKRIRKEEEKKTISFETIISILMDVEVLKGES